MNGWFNHHFPFKFSFFICLYLQCTQQEHHSALYNLAGISCHFLDLYPLLQVLAEQHIPLSHVFLAACRAFPWNSLSYHNLSDTQLYHDEYHTLFHFWYMIFWKIHMPLRWTDTLISRYLSPLSASVFISQYYFFILSYFLFI